VYTRSDAERGPILPLNSLGKKTTAPLVTNVRTKFIDLVLRTRVVVATAALAAIRNRGSAFALLAELGITEGQIPTWQVDPRVLRFQSEQMAPSKTTSTNLSALAIGTYDLVDRLRIPFAHPFQRDPRETWYIEKNPLADFSFYATLDSVANAVARLADITGGAVVTIPSMSLDVKQVFDRVDTKLPIYLPKTEMITTNVNASSRSFLIPLKVTDNLRSITLTQDSDAGEVTDIINSVTLRGDNFRFIDRVSMDDLARASEYEQGGDVYASVGGRHVYINFQEDGKLTRVLNPLGQDTNLVLELDVQPSVTAGATNSRIITTLNKLTRPAPDGGRVIVDPNPPFNLQ
jgi:hypothetical protein